MPGARDIRPPEWVLEEMYKTGRRWMAARARQRQVGPYAAEAAVGGRRAETERHALPRDTAARDAAAPEAAAPEAAAHAAADLRDRFQQLMDEFIRRVERE